MIKLSHFVIDGGFIVYKVDYFIILIKFYVSIKEETALLERRFHRT